jgi:serine/threonine protein kinase
MHRTPTDLKGLFCEALDRPTGPERSAYLDDACRGAPALRAQVEELLKAHDRAGRFLDTAGPGAAVGAGATLDQEVASAGSCRPLPEGPGARIGPYKLLQQIGEGGMGTVFMAEQETPVRRRVALKIIKAGMDSAQVVARFEAERQALALMDHPNIARVFDAGTTESGRPYFVMELVKGISIIDYCDQVRLSTDGRLGLFVPVCQAIQHAHQKGIIHRDVKPSNVLVTLIDGKPVPKVIDFGVAKATDQRLTEKTMFTQFGAVVGTLEYMSPEQAEISGLDVDTRSDIYGLGVMLYELLTGTTPLERERLRAAGHAEILRRIREEEPPKPSTRLSSSGDRLASIAATRGTEPARLARTVRGDLDWIVMKALEKDRTRRYESASGLARDIERHLSGDPVEACPPSASYRLRKFARKHRAGLVTAGAFAVLLALAAVVSTWQAVRATAAERLAAQRLAEVERANAASMKALADARAAQAAAQAALRESEAARRQAEAIATFGIELFRSPDPAQDGREIKVVELLDRSAEKLSKGFDGPAETKGALLGALGETYLGLGIHDRAIALQTQARAVLEAALGPDHPLTLVSRIYLGEAYGAAGRIPEAIALNEPTLKLCEARMGPDHPLTLINRIRLGEAYEAAGRIPEAVALDEATLKLSEAALGPDHRTTLTSRNNLAMAFSAAGRIHEAIALDEVTLKLREEKLGPDDLDTLNSRNNLAADYVYAGRFAEALALEEATLSLLESKLGPHHPRTLTSRINVGSAYKAAGRTAEALAAQESALKLCESKLGNDHPLTLASRNNLAVTYLDSGRSAEAFSLSEANLKLCESKLGPDHPTSRKNRSVVAIAALITGRLSNAEPLLRGTVERARGKTGSGEVPLDQALANLGVCLFRQAKWSEAEAVLRECLAIREQDQPEERWGKFDVRSLLGGVLLNQGRYAEAEPLVVSGYEGMKARETSAPLPDRPRLSEAAERVMQLYEAWGKPDRAAQWKAKLGLAELPADVFQR